MGFFLVKAGGALIDNMAILFAIGVAVGLAEESDGTAGLAGLVSWLMITTLLSSGSVAAIAPAMVENEVNAVAFSKIANPFTGILAGIIGAVCYNKFKGTKLPDVLAFFSGKRSVAIVTGPGFPLWFPPFCCSYGPWSSALWSPWATPSRAWAL